jgi:hypothetical protein
MGNRRKGDGEMVSKSHPGVCCIEFRASRDSNGRFMGRQANRHPGVGAIRQCRHSVDRVNCGIAFATLDLSSFAFLQSVDICGIG